MKSGDIRTSRHEILERPFKEDSAPKDKGDYAATPTPAPGPLPSLPPFPFP
jgi:hypothetical protein